MIALNLLPDVKLEYIRAQHQRRLIFAISLLCTAVSIGLLALLFSVSLVQKHQISSLSSSISKKSNQLKQKPQIDRILTVQNQLKSLSTLHDQKPAASRLFGYLNSVTPSNVSINSFQIDFNQTTVTITGTSDSLASVNKYVDTLKFTKYGVDGEKADTSAFSNVVLSSFGLSTTNVTNKNQAANYSIALGYDKTIFDTTRKVELSVPNLTTTRSSLDQPTDLFQAAQTQGGTQ
jgi:Tfp pilus assembly protein PilN